MLADFFKSIFHSILLLLTTLNATQWAANAGINTTTNTINTLTADNQLVPQQQQQQKPKQPYPSCNFAGYMLPVGQQFEPKLPESGPSCSVCNCTLELDSQTKNCYYARLRCSYKPCPEVPDECPDGSGPPIKPPGACCPTCDSKLQDVSTTTTTKPVRSSSWTVNRRQQVSSRSSFGRTLPNNNNNNFMLSTYQSTLYDSVKTKSESIWMFKTILREANDRVLIAAVKSVPICPAKTPATPASRLIKPANQN